MKPKASEDEVLPGLEVLGAMLKRAKKKTRRLKSKDKLNTTRFSSRLNHLRRMKSFQTISETAKAECAAKLIGT